MSVIESILEIFKGKEYKHEVQRLMQQNKNAQTRNKQIVRELREQHKLDVDKELVLRETIDTQQSQINTLSAEISRYKTLYEELQRKHMSFEQQTALQLQNTIDNQNTVIHQNNISLQKLEMDYSKLVTATTSVRDKLVVLVDIQEMETFGIYHPRYDYATASIFKEKLKELRKDQKDSIKNRTAVNYNQNWKINGDLAQGAKMNDNNIKQLLRAFNTECEAAIYKVTLNNMETVKKRIQRSFDELNQLNQISQVSITEMYLELKISEMYMAYEYEVKKEEERDILRQQRDIEKEEKIRLKEIEKQKEKKQRDIDHSVQMQTHMDNKILELDKMYQQQQLQTDIASQAQLRKLQQERDELLAEKSQLIETTKQFKDEQAALTTNVVATAGYVYIISNVGAFGKDVVKIGVTRRLNPEDRIQELSSASVPFKFDTHALIYSDDAFALENELHTYFHNRRVNKVNNRKEFFNITMNEIVTKLEEYKHLTIKFDANMEADEYRQTLAITQDK